MSRRFVSAWDPEVIPLPAQAIADAVHAHGAKIFGQLTHGGHTSLEHPPHILWAPIADAGAVEPFHHQGDG